MVVADTDIVSGVETGSGAKTEALQKHNRETTSSLEKLRLSFMMAARSLPLGTPRTVSPDRGRCLTTSYSGRSKLSPFITTCPGTKGGPAAIAVAL